MLGTLLVWVLLALCCCSLPPSAGRSQLACWVLSLRLRACCSASHGTARCSRGNVQRHEEEGKEACDATPTSPFFPRCVGEPYESSNP